MGNKIDAEIEKAYRLMIEFASHQPQLELTDPRSFFAFDIGDGFQLNPDLSVNLFAVEESLPGLHWGWRCRPMPYEDTYAVLWSFAFYKPKFGSVVIREFYELDGKLLPYLEINNAEDNSEFLVMVNELHVHYTSPGKKYYSDSDRIDEDYRHAVHNKLASMNTVITKHVQEGSTKFKEYDNGISAGFTFVLDKSKYWLSFNLGPSFSVFFFTELKNDKEKHYRSIHIAGEKNTTLSEVWRQGNEDVFNEDFDVKALYDLLEEIDHRFGLGEAQPNTGFTEKDGVIFPNAWHRPK